MKKTIALSLVFALAVMLSATFCAEASELLAFQTVSLEAGDNYIKNTPEDVFRIVNESAKKELESGKLTSARPTVSVSTVQNNDFPSVSLIAPVRIEGSLKSYFFGR